MKTKSPDLTQLRLRSQDELPTAAIKEANHHDIAIIGIYTRFPNARNTEAFWENIKNGVSCVTKFPEKRRKDADRYVRFSGKSEIPYSNGAYLEDIDAFDYSFFNIPPKEAILMNPRQRVFLEAAWNVFEDAGYGPQQLAGSNIGVYAGHIGDVESYVYREMIEAVDPSLISAAMPGNLSSIIPSRISYLLNFKGPSMIVDTACSSSLIAVDLACHALRRGDCEMALAGAVRINLLPQNKNHAKLGIESTDDETRAFDDEADGSGMGEGAAIVLLKPLSKAKRDGDSIYCVIKGSAVNQDGASMGITAPNPSAQTAVLNKAWKEAGIDPATLAYIETHGTGTKLGDPIEIEGISKAFAKYTDKKQFCAIGSVKTNIGHLYDCAGIAGLIKAALALKHQLLPPSIHFKTPNKQIPFIDSPVYINTSQKPWAQGDAPRRCGVSSFGLSGTNCHVVLEEYIAQTATAEQGAALPDQSYMIPLSAKSEEALDTLLLHMGEYFDGENRASLKDISYTLAAGRDHHPLRLAVVASDIADLKWKLQQLISQRQHLTSFDAPWFSYGTAKLAGDKDNFVQLAEQLVKQLKAAAALERSGLLQQIAELYTAGAAIGWSAMYRGSRAKRAHIPVYPFERKRSWLQIPGPAPAERSNALYYTMKWIEEAADHRTRTMRGETAIILGEWPELTQQLEEEGVHCIHVKRGTHYQVLNPESYIISEKEEDYDKLTEALKHVKFTKILHLLGYNGPDEMMSAEQLNERQSLGVYSLFHLTKALLSAGVGHKHEIIIAADYVNQVTGEEACLKPENSPLFGLGKVIGIEYPHITCKAIDVDGSTTVREVISELGRNKTTYQIAYRNGKRFAEIMEETDVEQMPDNPVSIKEEGVYVITGGAGNLGLLTAKHLASKGKINLALLNRSSLPKPEEWGPLLEQADGSRLHDTIKKLHEIAATGAQVECISLDVTSLDEMSATMERLRQKYGKINGIIHAAGVAGRGFLIRKDTAVFEEVLNPKVMGTWILDKVTEQDELDFFVLFSSGVALVGEMGQGDYTAANCYLDAFADYRRKRGKPALAINWVVWDGARMGEGTSETIDSIFKTLPATLALHGFDKVISKDLTRVLIGEVNTSNPSGLELFSKDVFHLPEKLRAIMFSDSSSEQAVQGKPLPMQEAKVKLLGSNNGSYSEVEQTLAGLYREVLGYEELSIHDTFFELGGDSVQLHRLHKLVEQRYTGQTSIADLFAYASIAKLASFLTKEDSKAVKRNTAARHVPASHDDDIAIIGMSALFPGADTVDQYWTNISNAVDCTGPIPQERREYAEDYLAAIGQLPDEHPGYMDCAYVEGIDEFDYRFFRISPKEANLTDPCQRVFMQKAWHAIEDAGYGGDKLRGSRTGIYVGFANIIRDSYQKMLTDVDPVMMSEAIVGNVSAMLPSRISHLLDLKGPTMVVDTACSSSLVAVHLASNAIRGGDCDMAIVGGVKLFLIPLDHEHNKIGIESTDGKTRAFDAYADGSGSGEGTAAIILKPLSKAKADGDHIHAVIKGSAINQDGASMGITAPNPAAQTDVITRAWEKAGIHPESIAFFEAHGTGTALGDPIEFSGLKQAIEAYTDKKQFCAIGSVKSNIGHLNEGAGMASIIKAVMALKHREIPPTLYFQTPNSKIDLQDSPLFINAQSRKWEDDEQPMRCAVSSFGLSGTNCHMIIEEYKPEVAAPKEAKEPQSPPQILTLSAASKGSLIRLARHYADRFMNGAAGALTDICYTANTGRGHYSHRLALIVADAADLSSKLKLLAELETFSSLPAEGIYYGEYRAVSDERSIRNPGDITEARKSELGRNGEQAVLALENAPARAEALKQLCQLYVQGADIPWEQLYSRQPHAKVQLPVYPFERTKCWAEFPKHTKRTLSHAAFADTAAAMEKPPAVFTMSWKQQARLAVPAAEPAAGVTVIVKDNEGFADRLASEFRDQGRQVLIAEIPDWSMTEEMASVEARLLDSYRQLLQESEDQGIARIIHCGSLTRTLVSSIDELKESQHRGALSLFLLMKAWAACGFEHDTEIIVLTENACRITGEERQLRPENAPLLGLAKALSKEHSNISCRSIDMDEEVELEDVLSELSINSDARLVAFRNGTRYVELFEPCSSLNAPSSEEMTVQAGGVYLITGGTGGIGLETAKWLSVKGRIKLVLINRSEMPDRRKWDGILLQNEDRKLCEKIASIREIEASGSEVVLYRSDVSNYDETASMLEDIRLKHGEIKGIVHGAGIARTESITEKRLDTFEQVISAKVYGTWLLDRLTQQDHLDFFIMYSSVATMFETGYQSDYLAANAYLDAYSTAPSSDGRRRLTINWTTWKGKGMASDHNFQADTIFKTIQAARAMELLDLVWRTPQSRVLIGELNMESRMALWLHNYSIQLSDDITASLDALNKRLAQVPERSSKSAGYAAVTLIGSEHDAFSETERQVAQTCKGVLGFSEIDIHESFFEMGADSLMIRQIYQKLSQLYTEEVIITDMFEYPTVHKLARHIERRQAGMDTAAAPMNNRTALQDDELNRMFDELDNGALDIEQVLSKLGSKER
ncbi:Phosphopantetheine attachment site [Paenibacillus algorifonticola]|uniref:Phosphopantetheine attachment site n=1 Tax=Paenibacillus algorifonticola TaxID=684063 RepID=A0A1I1YXT5_9BACL|nr:SDR family NAD(P)-dependent oxidoreductase [Paenibacillus algorifonticola]SFE22850.1 Phosphopantetheine attachment site [Paenibacillus algorifonticola]